MQYRRFVNGEFYHVYNRGVDKRKIFLDDQDFKRFLQSIKCFNSVKPIGSLYAFSFHSHQLSRPTAKLIEIVAYCLNQNHFHLILRQLHDGGISEFMKRVNGGYAWYFNNRYRRNGALFQGKFKFKHVDNNNYLLHLSAYVNLNDRVHRLSRPTAKSSWEEYIGKSLHVLCVSDIVLSQFADKKEYRRFAESSLEDILERKTLRRELETFLLEDIA